MRIGLCKLCLRQKSLAQSHLMPRALYDLCQIPGVAPVLISPEVVMSTARHTKDHLLCSDCEQLLNRNGEGWLLPKLFTVEQRFPFYEILASTTPDISESDMAVYAAIHHPQIDIACVIHFAMALFWKASVHSWSGGRNEPSIALGPYSEELRKFLLGANPFPKNIELFVNVTRPAVAVNGFAPPYEGSRMRTWRNFLCFVPGVQFFIAVGKLIPSDLRSFSFSGNSARPILVWDTMAHNIRELHKSVYLKAHKAKKFLEARRKRSESLRPAQALKPTSDD